MRYLKIASKNNPDNDFIELNDFNGFFCTSIQTLGISRKREYLAIGNRQFLVDDKIEFKKYRLTIEILTKYAEYEREYHKLINFLDRNKKGGFRLYYRPYEGSDTRYCFCDIEILEKLEKKQPVVLTLSQNSLWLGAEQSKVGYTAEQGGNIFAFAEDEDISGYYSASFYENEEIEDYYCISFYNGIGYKTDIVNESYNEIPLIIKIYGECTDATVSLYDTNNKIIKQLKIIGNISNGYYVEINANISENGVWYKEEETGKIVDNYEKYIDNSLGSPYFYIDHGEYYITMTVTGGNPSTVIQFQEEYNE